MIRVTMDDAPEGKIGFTVAFDEPADALAAIAEQEVQVELTPAAPLTEDVRRFVSELIGSASREYMASRIN